MLLSLNWLREFVPYEGDPQTLADRLTMLGLEVEGVHHPFAGLAGVVVGRVLTREAHPGADKLSVCTVDVGGPQAATIVCGAPNVAAGQTVAVALPGSKLPGGQTITKAAIRGVESSGMICSESELGLSEQSAGIMVLEDRFRPGQDMVSALVLDETVLEISVTPNRADCLSILGLARETALAFGLPLTMPRFEQPEKGPNCADMVAIHTPEPELCPVYRARVISGVEIGSSPAWMRYRLTAMGQRPVNNVVDVTNYVMLELGQPLHAFDRNLLAGGAITVKRASQGLRFTTLDGQERVLTGQDLLIWDQAKPVALAGVMGGENTEIGNRTTEVLLECAVFDAASIRRTARRLGLSSESSYRFERGVDQPGSLLAMNRAASLIAQVGGGHLWPGIAASEPKPYTAKPMAFRTSRAAALLGVEITGEFCLKTLQNLGCELLPKASDCWDVTPPPWRLDLEREVDLVEEVGRVYGMDRIPAKMPGLVKALGKADQLGAEQPFMTALKSLAAATGLRETVNYSFVGTSELDLFGLSGQGWVKVANPLSEDQNVMRPVLAPGLLKAVRHNLNQGNPNLRLFELAKVFTADPSSETTVAEGLRLAVALYGARFPGFPWPEERADYADLKGVVDNLLNALGLRGAGYRLIKNHSWLSPGVEVFLGDQVLGLLGRVLPDVAESFEAKSALWLAELDAEKLWELCQRGETRYKSLPKFPPVRRDLTLICAQDLGVNDILAAIRSQKASMLEEVAVQDLFIPKDRPEKNLTFRLTYRHPEKTLTDKDVDKVHLGLREALTKALPVRLQ